MSFFETIPLQSHIAGVAEHRLALLGRYVLGAAPGQPVDRLRADTA
jgi:hypothetical protein